MIIRYDFGEKLDLSRFQKQAVRQIGLSRNVTYHLFVKDYKITAEVTTPDDSNTHQVELCIFELIRDKENEISQSIVVKIHQDTRFKEIKYMTDLFPIDSPWASFESNNATATIEILSLFIKIIHKINGLKVFL